MGEHLPDRHLPERVPADLLGDEYGEGIVQVEVPASRKAPMTAHTATILARLARSKTVPVIIGWTGSAGSSRPAVPPPRIPTAHTALGIDPIFDSPLDELSQGRFQAGELGGSHGRGACRDAMDGHVIRSPRSASLAAIRLIGYRAASAKPWYSLPGHRVHAGVWAFLADGLSARSQKPDPDRGYHAPRA